MKKSTMITLIVAAALILVGCAVAVVAIALGGQFDTRHTHSVTHAVEGDFSGMEVTAGAADVTIRLSDTGACYAVCDEDDRVTYTLAVEGDTLYLRENDARRWYDQIGIFIGSRTVTLYLPAGVYDRLTVKTASGRIAVGDVGLTFADLRLKSNSGSIALTASDSSTLYAESDSGAVSVADLTADAITVKTASGAIELAYVRANSVTTTAQSGRTAFYYTIAADTITAESSSGDISLTACDAGDLTLSATSGSITGTLLTGKDFDAKSGSGSIRLPDSVEGSGKCMVITKSGNIKLTVSDE